MSDPTTTAVTPDEEAVIEGVILRNPKIRNVVAAAGALIGTGLSATTVGFASLAHTMPSWLIAANAIFTFVNVPAFRVWKANIK